MRQCGHSGHASDPRAAAPRCYSTLRSGSMDFGRRSVALVCVWFLSDAFPSTFRHLAIFILVRSNTHSRMRRALLAFGSPNTMSLLVTGKGRGTLQAVRLRLRMGTRTARYGYQACGKNTEESLAQDILS